MERYLPYDPSSTVRVEEQISVRDNRAFLRHIPKEGSIQIDGFVEVDGAPIGNQFFCDYATDSLYRDANRVIVFGSVDDFTFLTVNYIAVGTVVIADDMNEIKAHLENDSLHGGSDNFFHNVGNFVCFPYVTGDEDSWSVAQYEHDFQDYAGRPSQNYDLVNWGNSGSTTGWAIRIDDKWINLGVDDGDTSWAGINPLLTIQDRKRLAERPAFPFIEFTPTAAADIATFEQLWTYFQEELDYAGNTGSVPMIEKYLAVNQLARTALGDNSATIRESTIFSLNYQDRYLILYHIVRHGSYNASAPTSSYPDDIWVWRILLMEERPARQPFIPILTAADRKLLDYLHEQLDDQID